MMAIFPVVHTAAAGDVDHRIRCGNSRFDLNAVAVVIESGLLGSRFASLVESNQSENDDQQQNFQRVSIHSSALFRQKQH